MVKAGIGDFSVPLRYSRKDATVIVSSRELVTCSQDSKRRKEAKSGKACTPRFRTANNLGAFVYCNKFPPE